MGVEGGVGERELPPAAAAAAASDGRVHTHEARPPGPEYGRQMAGEASRGVRGALPSRKPLSSFQLSPSLHATTTGPAALRSSRMARYISRARSILRATRSVLTGLPAGPVCFVTRVPPSMRAASAGASAAGTMCTPPARPLVNLPRPRPPARTWALTTTCLLRVGGLVEGGGGGGEAVRLWDSTAGAGWRPSTHTYLSVRAGHLGGRGRHVLHLGDGDAGRHVDAVLGQELGAL